MPPTDSGCIIPVSPANGRGNRAGRVPVGGCVMTQGERYAQCQRRRIVNLDAIRTACGLPEIGWYGFRLREFPHWGIQFACRYGDAPDGTHEFYVEEFVDTDDSGRPLRYFPTRVLPWEFGADDVMTPATFDAVVAAIRDAVAAIRALPPQPPGAYEPNRPSPKPVKSNALTGVV